METLNGYRNGGPTWKWLAGVVLGILLTVAGGVLGWVAVTVQELTVDVAMLSVQIDGVKHQVDGLNARFDKQDARTADQDARLTQLRDHLAATTDKTDWNAYWIDAHAAADRAIRRAEQAKHPKESK